MALFTDPKTPLENPEDLPDDDQEYNIEDFVGEGKKYKTLADVAKALVTKDNFIEQLKGENKLTRTAQEKLQDELKTRKTLQEFLDQMNSTSKDSQAPAKEPNNEEESGEFTTESIKQIVEQTLTERTVAQREQDNLEFVKQNLVNSFGARYETKLRERTQELGMTEQDLTAMAMKTPKAFLTLVLPASAVRASLFTPPSSSVNSESFKPRSGAKTWSYYENIRKTDPKRYFSPQMHNEMMGQLSSLGDEDFYK